MECLRWVATLTLAVSVINTHTYIRVYHLFLLCTSVVSHAQMRVIVSQISPLSVVAALSCGVVLLCAAFESQVYSRVELTSLEHLASDLRLIKLHLTQHLPSLSASAPPPCMCPAALHLDGLLFIFTLTTSPLWGVIVKPGSVSPFCVCAGKNKVPCRFNVYICKLTSGESSFRLMCKKKKRLEYDIKTNETVI